MELRLEGGQRGRECICSLVQVEQGGTRISEKCYCSFSDDPIVKQDKVNSFVINV